MYRDLKFGYSFYFLHVPRPDVWFCCPICIETQVWLQVLFPVVIALLCKDNIACVVPWLVRKYLVQLTWFHCQIGKKEDYVAGTKELKGSISSTQKKGIICRSTLKLLIKRGRHGR
jgi:hypothetical protein